LRNRKTNPARAMTTSQAGDLLSITRPQRAASLTYGTGRSLPAIAERGEGSSANGPCDCLLSSEVVDRQLLAGQRPLLSGRFATHCGSPRSATAVTAT